MKFFTTCIIVIAIASSCNTPVTNEQSKSSEQTNSTDVPIEGTWKLLSGTTIEKGTSTVTDYTKDKEFIKIINKTHFAFLSHELGKMKDSAAAYSSGGGTYTLKDSSYTEHLDFCSDRQWEGNSFEFKVSINGDTLVQKGIEKVENIGVDRINIERYTRVKS